VRAAGVCANRSCAAFVPLRSIHAPCTLRWRRISVAHALKEIEPNVDIQFVCDTREEDLAFLKKEGWSAQVITAPRLSPSFLWKFPRAYHQAKRILSVFKPDVICSKGGYVSVPLCCAAQRKKIPIVLHESDAVSGRANRIVARWASQICTGFPLPACPELCRRATRYPLPATFTGNPIRPSVLKGNPEEGFRIAGLEGRSKPILLVYGGSQGAIALNEYVRKHREELLETFDIIHLTGRGKRGLEGRHEGYWSKEFAHEELPHLYAATDIAVSRAGMSNVTELAANDIPIVLIPLRGAGHDHQEVNARTIEKKGGCIVVEQKEMELKLIPALKRLNDHPEERRGLAENARHFIVPDAALQIAKIIFKCLAERG